MDIIEPIQPVTSLTIAVTVFLTFLGFSNDFFTENYLFDEQAILKRKEFYRIFTSGFLHADIQHLFFNMLTLYFFGFEIEKTLGGIDFLCIYIGGILGGNLFSLWIYKNTEYNALGASGGTCAIIYAFVCLEPWVGMVVYPIQYPIPACIYAIAFLVVSYLAFRRKEGNIGHGAHIGGSISGIVILACLDFDKILSNFNESLALLISCIIIYRYIRRDIKIERRDHTKQKQRYEKFLKGVREINNSALNECKICKRTEITNPELEFRVNSSGDDYCSECRNFTDNLNKVI